MKGYFKAKNPVKYKGDPSYIIYRSSYELKLMSFLDSNDGVLQWSSEEFFIPYRSPIDGKIHRYFPDFWVKKKTKDNKIDIVVIEVKPQKETVEPKKSTKLTKSYLYEVRTWAINNAKWDAAKKYCDDRGWEFVIMTEKELGIR